MNLLMFIVKRIYFEKYINCKDIVVIIFSCLCYYYICVGWYFCGFKYCCGKDFVGRYVSYRCGIKICRRFLFYDFVVDKKYNCFWDDI